MLLQAQVVSKGVSAGEIQGRLWIFAVESSGHVACRSEEIVCGEVLLSLAGEERHQLCWRRAKVGR